MNIVAELTEMANDPLADNLSGIDRRRRTLLKAIPKDHLQLICYDAGLARVDKQKVLLVDWAVTNWKHIRKHVVRYARII